MIHALETFPFLCTQLFRKQRVSAFASFLSLVYFCRIEIHPFCIYITSVTRTCTLQTYSHILKCWNYVWWHFYTVVCCHMLTRTFVAFGLQTIKNTFMLLYFYVIQEIVVSRSKYSFSVMISPSNNYLTWNIYIFFHLTQ